MITKKTLKGAYPPHPETMIWARIRKAPSYRLNLKTKKSWIVHPNDKDEKFKQRVEEIVREVREGRYPDNQSGLENLQNEEWYNFLQG
jgi:hypothetical protein